MWYGRYKMIMITGISKAESNRLVGAIIMRKKLLLIGWPVAAGVAVMCTLQYLLFRLLNYGPDAVQDFAISLRQQEMFGIDLEILLVWSIPLALYFILLTCLYRRQMHRQIDHHLFTPACFWCGYLLIGLERKNGGIRCPECSKTSPCY